MDDSGKARDYYDHGDLDKLLELANRVWSPDLDAEFSAGDADVFFFARSLSWRKRENRNASWAELPEGWKDALVQRDLWHARALSTAVLTGDRHTVARLQLQSAFQLMGVGAYAEARSVLGEMLRLVGPEHERRPVFMRLYEEKSAYTYLAEGRYGDAIARYTSALQYCENDPRGELKVRGGLALSKYLQRSDVVDEQGQLVDAMRQVRDEAAGAVPAYEDVASDASYNLKMMEAGEYEDWRPFELL